MNVFIQDFINSCLGSERGFLELAYEKAANEGAENISKILNEITVEDFEWAKAHAKNVLDAGYQLLSFELYLVEAVLMRSVTEYYNEHLAPFEATSHLNESMSP